jgi:hypothetical protein
MAKGSQKKERKRPQKGKNLTESEKIDIATAVCELYETDQYSLTECLNQNGVKSRTTWYSWVREIEQIEQLYKEAQKRKDAIYRHTAKQRARTALERALEGYEKELTQREGVLNPNGTITTTKIKTRTIYIQPKLQAALYVLNNFDKENFERNPKGETDRKQTGKFDDWTNEQIEAELRRLEGEEN